MANSLEEPCEIINHFYMVRTPPVENDEPLFHVLIEYSYSKFDSVEGTESRPPLPIPNRSQSTRIWNFNHGPFTLDMYLVLSLARCCCAGQCRLKRKFRCFLLPDTTLGYTESLDRMLAVIAEGFKPLFTISAKSPQPIQTMR